MKGCISLKSLESSYSYNIFPGPIYPRWKIPLHPKLKKLLEITTCNFLKESAEGLSFLLTPIGVLFYWKFVFQNA